MATWPGLGKAQPLDVQARAKARRLLPRHPGFGRGPSWAGRGLDARRCASRFRDDGALL